jgi:hypothetical protein
VTGAEDTRCGRMENKYRGSEGKEIKGLRKECGIKI